MAKSYDVDDAQTYGWTKKYRMFPSARFSLGLVGFLGSIVLYLMRVNVSIALICMTIDENTGGNVTTQSPQADVSLTESRSYMWAYLDSNWRGRHTFADRRNDEQCPGEGGGDEDSDVTGEFYWDRDMRGMINSSFFWGYVLTQVIGGLLGARFGCKWVIAIGVFFQIVPTFLSPPASYISPYALMAMRFIEGLGSGVYYPCFHHLWAIWAPPGERSFLLTMVLCGTSWGSVISFALSGVICAELGWEWVFWIYGILAVLWFILWIVFAYDSPDDHPRISVEEYDYIKSSQLSHRTKDRQDISRIPWLKLCFSPCMVCIYVSSFCISWGGYTTLTSLPQYMEDVLKFDIKQNGFYSSIPHVCKFVMSLLLALLADALISRKILSVKYTRKLMESLAYIIPAILLITVTYLDCFSTVIIIVCFTFAEGFTAGVRAGSLTNMVDVAPRYAGVIMGIGNTIANSAGIFAPIVAASLTPDGSQEQWRNVFYVTVTLYGIGWMTFVLFSRGDVQQWAITSEQISTETENSATGTSHTKEDIQNELTDDCVMDLEDISMKVIPIDNLMKLNKK